MMEDLPIKICFDCVHLLGGKFRDDAVFTDECNICHEIRLTQTFSLRFCTKEEWDQMEQDKNKGN